MTSKSIAAAAAVLMAGASLAVVIYQSTPATSAGTEHDHEGEEESIARGPHRGRLLTDGDFGVEVTIYERGEAPRFRLYLYDRGRPIDPSSATVAIELLRVSGRIDKVRFTPRADYLVSAHVVEEPHSFDVKVVAERGGSVSRWTYAAYEGRVELTAAAAAESGIEIDRVGPASLPSTLRVGGRIVPDADRVARIAARYPGLVTEVRKRLGDPVEKGEVLAVVQSNESLQSYPITAMIRGTVVEKNVAPGEFADSGHAAYVVADLARVWADLEIYRGDLDRLRLGQTVRIAAAPGEEPEETTISYLSPIGKAATQTTVARVVLPNEDGRWRPGLFVSAEVLVAETPVPLAVRASALQKWRAWDVVFVRAGDVYQAQPVEIGRRGSAFVEVRQGLTIGQEYVAGNSFLLKADLGKTAASHDH